MTEAPDNLEMQCALLKAKIERQKDDIRGKTCALHRAKSTIKQMKEINRLKRIGVHECVMIAEMNARIASQRQEIGRLKAILDSLVQP